MSRLRRLGPLLAASLLLAVLAPVGGVQAQAANVVKFEVAGGTAVPVDIADRSASAPTAVRFHFNQANFTTSPDYASAQLQSVLVVLTRDLEPANEIQVSLSPASAPKTWSGDLAVGTPVLAKGLWTVRLTTVDSQGAQSVLANVRKLDVQATDTVVPRILVSGEVGGKVQLGKGDVLAVLPEDPPSTTGAYSGLRNVTYRLPGVTGSLQLAFPYLVSLPAFKEGSQVVTFRAVDRAGNAAERQVTVQVDTTAPTLSIGAPETIYVGFPSDVQVRSGDASAHNVTFQDGANLTSSPSPAGNKTHTFPLKATAPGNRTFTIRAIDTLGNTVERTVRVNSTIATTDTVVQGVALTVARPVLGESVSLRATVAQARGVVALDLNVSVSGDFAASRNVTVAGPGTAVAEFPVPMALGRHRVNVTVKAPSQANETNATNQDRTFDYEVFFARMTDNGTVYSIRAGANGLPSHAVNPDGSAFPLTLIQKGSGIAYQFKAAGNRTIVWQPSGIGSSQSDTPSPSSSGAPKDSPGPLMPLAALALLAFALARRQR